MNSEVNSKKSNVREGARATRNWENNASRKSEVRDQRWNPTSKSPKARKLEEEGKWRSAEHRASEIWGVQSCLKANPVTMELGPWSPPPIFGLAFSIWTKSKVFQRQ